MRAFLLLVTLMAATGGLLLGYVEHRRERAARSGAPPAEARRVEKPPPEPKPAPPAPVPAPPEKPAAPPPAAPDEEEIASAVRRIEALILKEDFTGAARMSERLVERHAKHVEAARLLDRIRRAERKAKAYAALTASLEARALPEDLHSVVLANGNSVAARSVKETPQGYEIEYVLGGKGILPPDRVISVASLSRQAYLSARWKEIQAGVASCKDPVDLFFAGVRKCFRDGLRGEGIGLLDRLLAMPDSGQVVAMYARDPEGKAVRCWEQAAGRVPLEPLAVEPPPEVAGSAAGPAGSAAGEAAGGEGLDAAALARARELIERAEAKFRDGGAWDARMLTQSAAKVLYGLPATDPRVRELNRRAGDLLEQVMKE